MGLSSRAEHHQRLFGVVQAWDDDAGLFLISPQRIGFGLIGAPISGGAEAEHSKLNLLLKMGWPVNTILQFCLYKSPAIDEFRAHFHDLRTNCREPILHAMSEEQMRFFEQGVYNPVDRVCRVRLHDTRLVICVTLPFKGATPSVEVVRDAQELRQSFDQVVQSVGFSMQRLTAKRYQRLMSSVLNHGPQASWRGHTDGVYDDSQMLCSQLLDADTAIDSDMHGLWLGDHARVRTLSPKRIPKEAAFGQAMRYLGDFMSGQTGIRENALLTMNVIFPDPQAAKSGIEKDLMYTTRWANGPLGRLVPAYQQRKESLDIAHRTLDDGDRLVRFYLGLAIFAPTEVASIDAVANAKAYLESAGGWQFLQDKYITREIFSTLLPLAPESDVADMLMRYKRMPSSYVVDLMPVMGAWRGTGSPMLNLFARDGQLMSVSPLDSQTNTNFIVVGESGSGKSVLAQQIVRAWRSADGLVRIIDVGYSYKNMVELLGGEMLEFKTDVANPQVINPFAGITSIDAEAGKLCEILEMMAAPKNGLDDLQTQELRRILYEAHAAHGTDLGVDHIAAILLDQRDAHLQNVGRQLFSFTTQGPYGRFFNGATTVRSSNPLLVVELEGLSDHPHLQRVVLISLMFTIGREIYDPNDPRRKLLLVDECWQVLADAGRAASGTGMADFLVGAARKVRKTAGSVGFISQNIADFYKDPSTVPIVDNCAMKLLLRQQSDTITQLEKDGRLALGAWGFQALRSLQTIKGQFSEIMVVSDGAMGVGRLVMPPFEQLLTSTDPADRALVAQKRKQGLGLVDAVRAVLAERDRTRAMGVA